MGYSSRSFLLVFLVLSASQSLFAQLDPTFGTGGRMQRVLPGTQSPEKSFLLPDGKILVLASNSSGFGGPSTYLLVRFNSDGTLDTSYGVNGEAQIAIPFTSPCCASRGITDALRQPDGKIVLVGADGDGLVLRINEDGTFDNTFSGDGIDRPNINVTGGDTVASVFYQADGKLVIMGRIGGTFLMRYDANGNLDPTYGDQGGFTVHPSIGTASQWAAGMQSGGRLLILTAASSQDGRVYRFNADGSLDNSFVSPDLVYASNLRKLLVLANDKILLGDAPRFTDQFQRNHSDLRLRRLNADGTLDTSFATAGVLTVDIAPSMPDRVLGMIEKPDGSVVVATQTDVEPNRTIFRGGYLALTQVDSSGGVTGRSLTTSRTAAPSQFQMEFDTTLRLQPDGKILVSTYHEPANDSQNRSDVLLTRHVGVPLTNYRFRGVPFDFSDFSFVPKGNAVPSVLRPTRNLYLGSVYTVFNFGLEGDIDVHSDYTANFLPELAAFRPSTGTWYISRTLYHHQQNSFYVIRWGLNGDIPIPYDYDGDSKSDIAVFRPSDGNWYIQNIFTGATQFVHWGLDGDKPVTGDFDGDSVGDVAVWRPSTGVWYILRSSDGQPIIAQFGLDGDIPVQEDYDGDGKTDIAVWRPSTGVWYIWRSADNGYTIMQFGLSGDVPTPGDYDGDTKVDISVWRSGTWYQFRSSTNSTTQFPYGLSGDIPLLSRN